MGLFGSKRSPGAAAREAMVSLYGKHPGAGDFLRVNASSPALRSLDEWLSAALPAAQRAGSKWAEAYAAASPLSFVYLYPEKVGAAALLGTMAPSSDHSGRHFPLVIYSELDLELAVREQAWLAGCRFLDEARRLLASRGALGKEALLQAAAALPPPSASSLQQARLRLSDHLHNVSCGAAFSEIFAAEGADQAGRALTGLQQVCRGGGSYAIACPLGVGADPAGAVALWLRLVQVLSHGKLLPGMLWSDHLLLLFLGRFTPRALLAMWHPAAGDHDLYDLRTVQEGAGRSIPAEQSLGEWLSALP